MENLIYECPKGCHNKKQSIEEIVEAGKKHKEKLFAAYANTEVNFQPSGRQQFFVGYFE
jgi:hypothetical protein